MSFKPGDVPVRLRFDHGLNTISSPNEIRDSECASGSKNFDLNVRDNRLRNRKAFDLVATATNGEPIRGFAQLKKQNGTRSTLIQAGTTVYEWDGADTFTSVGTVASTAKLRGPLVSNFTLDDVVIITDLMKLQPVMQWDGTTFSEMADNLSNTFFATHCVVDNERAWYFNVTAGTATPHMLVGSERGDYDNLSVSDRPSSALGEADPFFILAPDLKPIQNGLIGFNRVVFPTEDHVYYLTGASAKDFSVSQLQGAGGARGQESVAGIGNNIAIGKQGLIDTLIGVETFGDVDVDDLTRWIEPDIRNASEWQLIWNPRLKKLYCFPDNLDKCYVLHKSILDEVGKSVAQGEAVSAGDIPSPWSVWETGHANGFQSDCIWMMEDPADGLESIYMGGQSGEIFKFEGSGGQDGGTSDIDVNRTTKLFEFTPADATVVNGILNHEKRFQETITLKAKWQGNSIVDESTSITLNAATGGSFYGDTIYYNDSSNPSYYGSAFTGRTEQRTWSVGGRSSHMQLETSWSGSTDVAIQGIAFGVEAET